MSWRGRKTCRSERGVVNIIRTAIDAAVSEAIAEHPKYFTPKGLEHAQTVIVRKVMARLRDGGSDKDESEAHAEEAPKIVFAEAGSAEAVGYANLRLVAGANAPTKVSGDRTVIVPPANCAAVAAFATLPPRSEWRFASERKHLAAWAEFFRDMLPEITRRTIMEERNGVTGALLPWPYPPSKEGKIYDWDSGENTDV